VAIAGPASARADVARFRTRVENILADSRADRASWGILVADRDTGRQLYSLNADHFFTPASNAKIFTTALALATLGPDYRFHTTIESNGLLDNDGRLGGDLVLVGRGDPDLSNRKFPYDKKDETEGPIDKVLAEMADAAVANGLKEVDGDIVADDSYFPYDPYPEGWSVGDLFFKFGAPSRCGPELPSANHPRSPSNPKLRPAHWASNSPPFLPARNRNSRWSASRKRISSCFAGLSHSVMPR
jgi:D-alanyl-D-alanine carboxypeptidase/D-alanyl-D-alanine-endopeptidase (penicillin-binding protein 4)